MQPAPATVSGTARRLASEALCGATIFFATLRTTPTTAVITGRRLRGFRCAPLCVSTAMVFASSAVSMTLCGRTVHPTGSATAARGATVPRLSDDGLPAHDLNGFFDLT